GAPSKNQGIARIGKRISYKLDTKRTLRAFAEVCCQKLAVSLARESSHRQREASDFRETYEIYYLLRGGIHLTKLTAR
ncbi:hypothetical protein V3C99_010364, partial [Haemonchus contortus]